MIWNIISVILLISERIFLFLTYINKQKQATYLIGHLSLLILLMFILPLAETSFILYIIFGLFGISILYTIFSLLFWTIQFIRPLESYEPFPKRYFMFFLWRFFVNMIYLN